ncbi:hypothetical protein HD554DRAFT_2034357 [Boletus coccyginus]|nr:hypothetical protein HD554DRAFT_2034357 [Boletus coccyginus]
MVVVGQLALKATCWGSFHTSSAIGWCTLHSELLHSHHRKGSASGQSKWADNTVDLQLRVAAMVIKNTAPFSHSYKNMPNAENTGWTLKCKCSPMPSDSELMAIKSWLATTMKELVVKKSSCNFCRDHMSNKFNWCINCRGYMCEQTYLDSPGYIWAGTLDCKKSFCCIVCEPYHWKKIKDPPKGDMSYLPLWGQKVVRVNLINGACNVHARNIAKQIRQEVPDAQLQDTICHMARESLLTWGTELLMEMKSMAAQACLSDKPATAASWYDNSLYSRGGWRELLLSTCMLMMQVGDSFRGIRKLVEDNDFDFVIGFAGSSTLLTQVKNTVSQVIEQIGMDKTAEIWDTVMSIISQDIYLLEINSIVIVFKEWGSSEVLEGRLCVTREKERNNCQGIGTKQHSAQKWSTSQLRKFKEIWKLMLLNIPERDQKYLGLDPVHLVNKVVFTWENQKLLVPKEMIPLEPLPRQAWVWGKINHFNFQKTFNDSFPNMLKFYCSVCMRARAGHMPYSAAAWWLSPRWHKCHEPTIWFLMKDEDHLFEQPLGVLRAMVLPCLKEPERASVVIERQSRKPMSSGGISLPKAHECLQKILENEYNEKLWGQLDDDVVFALEEEPMRSVKDAFKFYETDSGEEDSHVKSMKNYQKRNRTLL